MTSLRSLLAFNMRLHRQVAGFSQEKLARRVGTSTHYVGMIESGKKFPSPEMLERIAAALGIDAPELFSTRAFPSPETGGMAEFQEEVLGDIRQILSYRIGKLNPKPPPDAG